ncbi:hypothetical protein E8E14_002765 [Neopestalotiopsis sp. 37M]|nr:hypothetical protein E8E14_002765 [Neopestalotiopsis sp. 37M]
MYGMAISHHVSLIYERVFSTTFSSLVVKRLRGDSSSDRTAVISIFLQPVSETKRQEAVRLSPQSLLAEIRRQLLLIISTTFQGNHQGHESPETSLQESPNPETNVDSLRCAIDLHIKSFDRIFLVLDDLDLAWGDFTEYQDLEEELDALNDKGIKILTTSRVQFKCDTRYIECDANPKHSGRLVDFWWQCSICRFRDPEVQAPYDVCDECKDAGLRCPEPEHSNLELVQPRTRVHLDIGNCPLEGFLEYQLEEEHGDIGFGSHGESFILPPLSSLGHELVSSPPKAVALVTYLNKRAKGNITIALLHLQDISQTMSFKEATTVSDRLPKSITAYFDAEVTSIVKRSTELSRELGLASIKNVGRKSVGLQFSDLKDTLLTTLKCSNTDLKEVLNSTYGMERVLAASRGLLCEIRASSRSLEFDMLDIESTGSRIPW